MDEMTEEEFYKLYVEKDVQNIIRFVDAWYYGRCPRRLGTGEFYKYIASSYGVITRTILGKELRPIIVKAAVSAFTDLRNIYIPANYFTKEFYADHGIFEQDNLAKVALALFNCFNIHEALHVRLTTEKFDKWAERYIDIYGTTKEFPDAESLAKNEIFVDVANIVEDSFIEAYGRAHYPALGSFLHFGRDVIVLGPFYQKRVVDNFLNEQTVEHFMGVLSLLVSSKIITNVPEIVRQILGDKIIALASKAQNPRLSQLGRQYIAFDIFRELMDMTEEGQEQGSGENEGEEGEEGNSQSDFGDNDPQDGGSPQPGNKFSNEEIAGNSLKNVPKQFDENNPPHSIEELSEGLTKKQREEVSEVFEKLVKALIEHRDETEDKQDKTQFITAPKNRVKVDYQDIVNDGYSSRGGREYNNALVIPDKKFLKIGNLLRHARAIKGDFGAPKDRGNAISKHNLHRIITDSKILKRRDAEKKLTGVPEVIILNDVSGSTQSSHGDAGYKDLLHTIVCGSYGAFTSLKRAQIPTAVYAHTADCDTSIIRGIASYNMPLNSGDIITTENHEARFRRALSMYHSTNADGDALAFVAKRFTKRDNTKIIIVLCDGRPTVYPNFPSVRFSQGVAWTRENVRHLREEGIVVFVFSLTQSVMSNNTDIYGAEFNIPAFGNIMQSLEKFIFKLGLRY